MPKEEGKQIETAVFDADILHIQAIRKTVAPTIRIHPMSPAEMNDNTTFDPGQWDLCLFCLDSVDHCTRRLLSRVLDLRGEMPLICYGDSAGGMGKAAAALQKTIPFLSFAELIHEISDFNQMLKNMQYFEPKPESFDPAEEELISQLKMLSPRELDIFCLISKGHGAPEISALFNCSVSTVETHIRNVRGKVQAGNSADLRRYGLKVIMSGHCRAFTRGEDHFCEEIKAPVGACPHVRCA